MPRVIITEGAVRGLARCRAFLEAVEAGESAVRAGRTIARHLRMLETAPDMGRPDDEMPELRELMIPFGKAGYVVLYRYLPREDAVYVLAVRHQKEAGY
ncbi:type II toxin-antitoxin system RelE/ParE family toxin [Alcanivorax marinus]|nr:type II toxin-antitoxin system RelE/ParE family toxin [Alloalcanivorax marinus]